VVVIADGTCSIQDALRAFLQPIKTDDPRIDFYTVYKKEATEYNTDYVKKYDEDLNTTLIFVRHLFLILHPDTQSNSLTLQAGLFSAVSSAFVIDIQSKLEPDPNEQSAALLRAVLFALNQSALPAETAVVPPTHEDPPSEIVTASSLMYASLLISLLAAFVAMLTKQWLNRYLRNAGGSMVERCGDRQRKCDGLDKWPLHLFVESLPVMLQISLLLLACGLCRHLGIVNTFVAHVLVALTVLGILFYLGIVVAGASSYECPFQTPGSNSLRGLWDVTRRRRLAIIRSSWPTLSRMSRVLKRWIQCGFPRPPPPAVLEGVQTDLPVGREVELSWMPKDPALSRTNANDIRCVSWILGNITDPEATDAAIRLAGTIRWFEDGIDVEPPYDVIFSTFKSCFYFSDKVYPGSMDRAYYSMRAILQIHVFATCRSQEFAHRFPLPRISGDAGDPGGYLTAILELYRCLRLGEIRTLYSHGLPPTASPAHLRWAANLLVQFAWTKRRPGGIPRSDIDSVWFKCQFWDELPPSAVLNCLLVWCIVLGGHIDEKVLKIEDKLCVEFHFFPLKTHTPPFVAFVWSGYYLHYPAQSYRQSIVHPTLITHASIASYWV